MGFSVESFLRLLFVVGYYVRFCLHVQAGAPFSLARAIVTIGMIVTTNKTVIT
jgi:hypothetical protein